MTVLDHQKAALDAAAEEESPQTNYMNAQDDDEVCFNQTMRSNNNEYHYNVADTIDQADYYYWNLPWPQEKRPRILKLLEQRSQSGRVAECVFIFLTVLLGLSTSVPTPRFLRIGLLVIVLLACLVPVRFWMDQRSIRNQLDYEIQQTFPAGALPATHNNTFVLMYP